VISSSSTSVLGCRPLPKAAIMAEPGLAHRLRRWRGHGGGQFLGFVEAPDAKAAEAAAVRQFELNDCLRHLSCGRPNWAVPPTAPSAPNSAASLTTP
jgi:hypothetical protein